MNYTDTSSDLALAQMKASSIICLTPSWHPCKNVPAIIKRQATNSTTTTTTAYNIVNGNDNSNGNDNGNSNSNGNGNCSCCHREHKKCRNHESHAMTSTCHHESTRGSRNLRERRRSNVQRTFVTQPAKAWTNNLPNDTSRNSVTTTTTTTTCSRTATSATIVSGEVRKDIISPPVSIPETTVTLSENAIQSITGDRILWTSVCLVDSFKSKHSQLVTPIGEHRLRNATVRHAISAKTPMNINGSTSMAITNNSHTTTIEDDCRCMTQDTKSDIALECNCSRQSDVARLAALTLHDLWEQWTLREQLLKPMVTSKSLFLLVILMLISTANCWAGRQDAASNCTFPPRWEGSWFLSGYQQSIHIKGSQFSYRGKCAASDGNKYLIVDEKGCHRCLVIYEKHKNVLQYKESECEGDSMYMHQSNPSAMAMRSVIKQSDHRGGAHPNSNGHSRLSSSDQYIMRSNDDMNDCPPDFCKGRETLQNLCDQIPGDALLYSLFRESAEPVKCPLKGPFVFTYNRGHGECKSPVSNIESCTEESRLLLSFQACPDVQGTESTVEELTCLATWKDGNSRYLVGLVSHHHAISNEERYRCFVYEKISSLMGGAGMGVTKEAEYKLAQSGDATCNGLDSAEVGSRIMSLRKPPIAERCDFPVWFKGPRHWHALMGNAVYNYHSNDGSMHIIKPNGYMETRALCEQINKQTSTEMMAVVHYTTGCQSGFMCMMFYRRDTHVIEIQIGKPASRLEDACAPDHFDPTRMGYVTLLASNPDPQICPAEGLYTLRGAIGPPYLTTRHKRNHNNKVHGLHGHHHLNEGINPSNIGHKRHSTLSFRNSDRSESDKGTWHSNTRGLSARSRRDAIGAGAGVAQELKPEHTTYSNRSEGEKTTIRVSSNGSVTETSVTFLADSDTRQRSRRDVPGCVTNYKAQRQLWVGCTEPNIVDVRPLCNEDGDEEYSCHGSWYENSTVYIIARHKGTKHGVCISYRPTEGNAAKLVIGDACYRGTATPPEHHLVANLTVFGKCGETGSAATKAQANGMLSAFCLIAGFLTTLFSKLFHCVDDGAVIRRYR